MTIVHPQARAGATFQALNGKISEKELETRFTVGGIHTTS